MKHSRATLAKPFARQELVTQPEERPEFTVADRWTSLLVPADHMPLETVLVSWLRNQRWFGGKAKTVTRVRLNASVPVPLTANSAQFNIVEVSYLQGEPELYALPLSFTEGARADVLREDAPQLVICDLRVEATGQSGVVHDAAASKRFCHALGELISTQQHIAAPDGTVEAWHTPIFSGSLGGGPVPEPTPARAEQSNSSVVYGNRFILKLLRRLYVGINPDLEITEFLTAREFPYSQQLAGGLCFRDPSGQGMTLGMLNRFVPKAKDAWAYTLDELSRYYHHASTFVAEGRSPPPADAPVLNWVQHELPSAASREVGCYVSSAGLLGERTAALHLALSSDHDDEAFAPEPFTPEHLRNLCRAMNHQATENIGLLREHFKALPPGFVPLAKRVLHLEPDIIARFDVLCERGVNACRIRCHGDFHLGQVLHAGGDFVIIDFEGEPAVTPDQRRVKRSPLRDVAGMVRSFDYAAWEGLARHVGRGRLRSEGRKLEPWLRVWHRAASTSYLQAYFRTMGKSNLLPRSEEHRSALFDAFLLNKAVYELGYELNNRPDWLDIPLQGILRLMEGEHEP
jgi:maltose alpha-D-glucosyltransferase / alpha-amylase